MNKQVNKHIYHNKFKKISCLLLNIFILLIVLSCSPETKELDQHYCIKGTVISERTGLPVSDVKISVDGTTRKTTTDSNGSFTIDKLSGDTITLTAEKIGKYVIPDFSTVSTFSGNSINVRNSSVNNIVNNVNFIESDELTISMIQGKGHISPLNGVEVNDIVGVVTYVGKVRGHYKYNSSTYERPEAEDQPVGEDGFYMQMVTPDENPLTSDGIFVNTRNPNSKRQDSKSDWLISCLPNNQYPKPGDIVKVSGTVVEYVPVDRFHDGLGNLSRTQINANSVKQTGRTQSIGEGVLLTYTTPTSMTNPDSYRVLDFDSEGLDALSEASLLFESTEGMLVRVENPIVTGGTYYNFTGVMADGGKKDGNYPHPFNEKWLVPILRQNDFNAEQIHVFWDNKSYDKENDSSALSLAKIPQAGTILAQDDYAEHDKSNPPYLTGVMDYNGDGDYIIYPFRKQAMNSNVPFKPHDDYNFVVNKDSFYYSEDIAGYPHIANFPADTYQKWIYQTGDPASKYPINMTTYNPLFSVPWDMEPQNSTSPNLSIAVFNLENYINQGYIKISSYPSSRKAKQDYVARAIVKAMKCPDIIFIVEMGDDDDSSSKIHYNNQNHSWLAPTGIVSARKNFMGLINVIEEFTRTDPAIIGSGIEYDYRQIDPIEFDQAGSPGNNIRVGFLFRTDRLKAHDIGLETHHKYNMPEYLVDEPITVEQGLTRLAQANANLLLVENGGKKELTLTQSPGYIQNDAFYHSRIPLITKFTFLEGNEYEQDFFAIAAHLYSKGPDAPLYGDQQPPVFTSEIRRGNQAKALNSYIREMKSLDPNAKIIVAGDMNDFGYTPAIKKLTGEFSNNQILYSMTDFMPEEERFTYYFRGNMQQLDHIFVTENLYDKAKNMGGTWESKVFIPHIDSLFSRNNHIQISDHDPIVALIDMSK